MTCSFHLYLPVKFYRFKVMLLRMEQGKRIKLYYAQKGLNIHNHWWSRWLKITIFFPVSLSGLSMVHVLEKFTLL